MYRELITQAVQYQIFKICLIGLSLTSLSAVRRALCTSVISPCTVGTEVEVGRTGSFIINIRDPSATQSCTVFLVYVRAVDN